MRKLLISAALCSSLGLSGCAADGSADLGQIAQGASAVLSGAGGSGVLSNTDIVQGLKAALETGSGIVVNQLGSANGFNGDSLIRIPLPDSLIKARDVASKFGLAGSFNELENRLNRAAELATPKAKALFVSAIRDMSVTDARGILNGPDNAATEFFRNKTGAELESAFRPIVDQSLAEVGAVNSFNSLVRSVRAVPGAPAINADLTGYVVEKGTDGIFYYLAEEEKAIRENPAKRTSEILQRVFGGS